MSLTSSPFVGRAGFTKKKASERYYREPSKVYPKLGAHPALTQNYERRMFYQRTDVRQVAPLQMGYFKDKVDRFAGAIFGPNKHGQPLDTMQLFGDHVLRQLQNLLLKDCYATCFPDELKQGVSFFEKHPATDNTKTNQVYFPACLNYEGTKVDGVMGAYVHEGGYLYLLLGYKRCEKGKSKAVYALAHEMVCWLTCGPPSIMDQVVMHSCDNPSCLCPAHLLRGTQSENLRRLYTLGKARRRGFLRRLEGMTPPVDGTWESSGYK